ncbi:MAG: transposase domain-containing protein [Aquidulcibacter sp.]|uniref:transposase domain-containing protein n=1 Tax=Aquidulcibacter sp. TaxID=2052990 RepID=UPI0022BC71C5|nr:transposase domain-containing protein [Aquidulcibacter sp.]
MGRGTAANRNIDPGLWLADILPRIEDHLNNRIHELLPWSWKPAAVGATALGAKMGLAGRLI